MSNNGAEELAQNIAVSISRSGGDLGGTLLALFSWYFLFMAVRRCFQYWRSKDAARLKSSLAYLAWFVLLSLFSYVPLWLRDADYIDPATQKGVSFALFLVFCVLWLFTAIYRCRRGYSSSSGKG